MIRTLRTAFSINFYQLWPLLRHPQLALPNILLEFRVVYKGRPLHALSGGGIGPCSGVGHFPVDKAADWAYHLAPGHWLQTGPCIPYGLRLRVATHIVNYQLSRSDKIGLQKNNPT